MFRVQWHRPTLFVLCFFLFLLLMPCAAGECWYKDELHAEGTEVITPEPCLNCTCNKGALLCYLRVCPTLPNPPPPGCILLHKFETCCPELICSDGHNYVEARSDPDEYNLLGEDSSLEEAACIVNGSIYGPGSAMGSSSLCEYCYCLGGKQICVSPRCLLSVEDCYPKYDPNSCCPIQYHCDYATTTISTTTRKSIKLAGKNEGGCIVDGIYYKEGDKVLGAGHSECDNCYCLRGVLRCEPLACAPPLFGCTPVIRAGECCAVSYNCSGVIEINPEPNYGEVPIVSKQYAKFHKEIQQPTSSESTSRKSSTENSHFFNYDLAEVLQTTKIQRNAIPGTTLHFATSTTTDEISLTNEKPSPFKSDNSGVNNAEILKPESTISLIDDRLHRKIESNEKNSLEDTTTAANEETTTDFTQTTSDYSTVTENSFTETTLDSVNTDSIFETTTSFVTIQTVQTSTDCIELNNSLETEQYSENYTNTQPTVHNLTDVISVHSVEAKNSDEANATTAEANTNIAQEISNETNISVQLLKKDTVLDYEYDYNEPTLPPSLPNVRIIPFLAADALDLKKSEASNIHSSKELDDSSYMNYNLFSPPVETEGGFIPKEPPILDSLYENTIASTTKIPKLHEISCFLENLEILHGEVVSSKSPCETCRCFYGNIVCQKVKCSEPHLGCKLSLEPHLDSCCPHYVCDDTNSTPVDRIDLNLNSEESPLALTNPTANVEVTSTSTTRANTISTTGSRSPFKEDTKISEDRDKLVSLLYLKSQSQVPRTTPSVFTTTNFKIEGKRSDVQRNSVDANNPSIAVLKLAGCNIYGRMYRVGRIISELSNPCLECKCTEVGVQCKALNC